MVTKIKTKVIYETRGRAREYCELACNLYKGCGHGCVYCYAPEATFTERDSFYKPKPRSGVLEKLRVDAGNLSLPWDFEERPIMLSFTCDPYQPIDVHYQFTRQALQILKERNLRVMILTKGGKRAERDFDLLTPEDSFGVTLTLQDETESLKWEPRAAVPSERVESLRRAKKSGIFTYVSLEPVIDTEATKNIIRATHEFVDKYKVGIMNYHSIAKSIDWKRFAYDVVGLLDSLGCEYYLKYDLGKYLDG